MRQRSRSRRRRSHTSSRRTSRGSRRRIYRLASRGTACRLAASATRATNTQARKLLKATGGRHLLGVEKGKVVGVLSDREVGGVRLTPLESSVSEVMSENVVTAEPDTTIRRAANLLRGRNIGCLP